MALPPFCEICNKDIRSQGEYFWIRFKATARTEEIEAQNGMFPGPRYTDRGAFFCKQHKVIEKYSHLTMAEAIEKVKNELE